MKNKLSIILMVLVLSLSFVSCAQKDEPKKSVENIEQSTNDTQTEEVKGTAKEEKESVNTSLSGEELIKSLSNKRPDKLMMKSEMTSFGMKTQITTYYDGVNSRTEMDVPDMGKSILIHLPDEGVMYQYVYGENNGVKMTGADITYAEEMGVMIDSSMFSKIVDNSSKDMTARVENLDGEKAIYIEATESDEDLGEVLVKMWYSEKYATPLKYEVVMGEKIMSQLEVTKITDSVKMDESLFMPPSDVTFEEVDMKKMMENY